MSDSKTITIYTDASYFPETHIAGWAFAAYSGNKLIHAQYALIPKESVSIFGSSNNAAEEYAVIAAVMWAADNNYKNITIKADSTHVYIYASSDLDLKSKDLKRYDRVYNTWLNWVIAEYELFLRFEHVLGHSYNPRNMLVDRLCRHAAEVVHLPLYLAQKQKEAA